jgi:hypothetical protein
VDKPLSQERLSEEELDIAESIVKRYQTVLNIDTVVQPSQRSINALNKVIVEVKRLQAIEDRYKSTLERIRTQAMQGDTAQTAWKVAKWSDEALEGADTNE